MGLLRGVVQARDEATASSKRHPKLVLKISPDLDSRGVDDIADAVGTVKGIDGVIVTNTTVQRPAHLRSGAHLMPLTHLPYLYISFTSESCRTRRSLRCATASPRTQSCPRPTQAPPCRSAYYRLWRHLIRCGRPGVRPRRRFVHTAIHQLWV